MNEIKPIQTYYDGHLFRSRLEARWAVVFNALHVPYEYEPEGFDLGDELYYLPDFGLDRSDLRYLTSCLHQIRPSKPYLMHQ